MFNVISGSGRGCSTAGGGWGGGGGQRRGRGIVVMKGGGVGGGGGLRGGGSWKSVREIPNAESLFWSSPSARNAC